MKDFRILLVVAALSAAASCGLAVATDAKPLPAVDDVLQRVVEKAQRETGNDEEFKDRYHFTRNRSTEYRNSKGELKKRESKTRVNKPDPAPAADLSASPDSTAVPGQHPANTNSTKFAKEEFLGNTNLLARFQFTMVGREVVDGRPALVIDFVPAKKKLPEPTLKDKFINKAAGRVWVDEVEDVLVKANFRLTEKVNLVGGLVGSV